MNAFQILDSEGQPIPINILDQEAADFWGKTTDPKYYVDPTPKFSNPDNLEGLELAKAELTYELYSKMNWYDCIGYTIANQTNYTSGWHNVVNSLIAEALGQKFINFDNKETIEVAQFEKSGETTISLPEKIEIKIYVCLEYYRPYIELIKYWHSKGYQPKQIKE